MAALNSISSAQDCSPPDETPRDLHRDCVRAKIACRNTNELLSIGETGRSLKVRCQGGGGYEVWLADKTRKNPNMLELYRAAFQRHETVRVFFQEPARIEIGYLAQRGIRALSARKVEEDALDAHFKPELWKRGRQGGKKAPNAKVDRKAGAAPTAERFAEPKQLRPLAPKCVPWKHHGNTVRGYGCRRLSASVGRTPGFLLDMSVSGWS